MMRGYLTHIEKEESKSLLKLKSHTKWQKRRILILWIHLSNRQNVEAIRKIDGLTDEQIDFAMENIKPIFLKEIEPVMIK